jgi:lysozyme family protein
MSTIRITKSKAFNEEVRVELDLLYKTCRITDPARFDWAAARARLGRAKYDQLSKELGIPWWFLACVHMMECGFSWEKHWHNGDPLTARTVLIPRGRPRNGQPPFGWWESAVDALTMPGKEFDKVKDWSMPHALWLLEKFNGHGYRLYRGIHTPYIWAGTNHYTRGKYVKDGVYSSTAVSKQAGCAGLIRILTEALKPEEVRP